MTRAHFPEKIVHEILDIVSDDTGVSTRTVAKYKRVFLRPTDFIEEGTSQSDSSKFAFSQTW